MPMKSTSPSTTPKGKSKRNTASRVTSLLALPPSFVPSKNDVICAKGKQAKLNPGNQYLNFLVDSSLEEYRASPSKVDRSYIVSQIINQVIRRGGLFVRQLHVGGQWFDIGPRNSREKIGQHFRDRLHDLFRSSTKAKAMIRRIRSETDTDSKEDSPAVTAKATKKTKKSPVQPKPAVIRSMTTATPSVSDFALPDTPVSASPPVSTPPGMTRANTDAAVRPETVASAATVDVDIEPLPVTHAIIDVDFDSMSASSSSEDSSSSQSFEDAMDEMYQSHFVVAPPLQVHCFYPAQEESSFLFG